jgi:hypothetical protein
VFHMGRIQSSVADLGRRLQETYYRRFPGAGSAIYSAVAARAQGQLQGPFRTPRGYVLLQVEGGGRSILEPEFEDVEFQAREFHRDWSFTAWANGTMRERGFAGPCH